MLALRPIVVTAVVILSVFGVPFQPITHGDQIASTGDVVLGVVGRQVAWLSLVAPRPQILTQLPSPAYATDVATLAGMPDAAIGVIEPYPGKADLGGDIVRLDLAAHTLAPIVMRASPGESLGSPAWMPDGAQLFFDRADLTGTPIQYPGQSYT